MIVGRKVRIKSGQWEYDVRPLHVADPEHGADKIRSDEIRSQPLGLESDVRSLS